MTRPRVTVLDHGMGNLPSVAKALEAAGAEVRVDAGVDASSTDALCVPGQGVFGRCMTALHEDGLTDAIRSWIADGRPYLGICLGMQVLFDRSEEGGVEGLGVVPGEVTRLTGDVRVPHIGWNTVTDAGRGTYYYFDHSFAPHPADDDVVKGWCEHGERFAAWIERDRLTAVQFHPEKSSNDGISLLRGWIARV